MDCVKIFNFRGRQIGRIECEKCCDIIRFARECNIRTLYLQPMCVGVDAHGRKIYDVDKFEMLQMSHQALKDFFFVNNRAKANFNVVIYPCV